MVDALKRDNAVNEIRFYGRGKNRVLMFNSRDKALQIKHYLAQEETIAVDK